MRNQWRWCVCSRERLAGLEPIKLPAPFRCEGCLKPLTFEPGPLVHWANGHWHVHCLLDQLPHTDAVPG